MEHSVSLRTGERSRPALLVLVALALLSANLPKVLANGADIEARSAMLVGSLLGGQAELVVELLICPWMSHVEHGNELLAAMHVALQHSALRLTAGDRDLDHVQRIDLEAPHGLGLDPVLIDRLASRP